MAEPDVTQVTRTLPPYTLPAATRLGRVRLQVADLERSLAFYADLLGFAVLARGADRAVLGVAGKGRAEGVLELFEYPGARPVPKRGRLGLYHVAVLLPDRAALGRVFVHLTRSEVRFGGSDHDVSEALYLNDPDGLGLEIYADRPREAWRWVGGELHMSTEPLGAESLIRAAGGVAWSGMPPGTTVGHIHLHVGDLARAAAFYEGVLGFETTTRRYPGARFLSAGGYHHHLGLNTWAVGASPAAADEARLLEWEVVLPRAADLEALAERLKRAGCAARRTDEDASTSSLRVDDPWGTTVRLLYR